MSSEPIHLRQEPIMRAFALTLLSLLSLAAGPARAAELPIFDAAVSTRHVASEHRNFGEFKVPSLRNVARTAPYMHDGSLATLRDVVRHYSEIDEDRLHADGERILKPLHLTDAEKDDLVSFLESLSDGGR